MTSGRDTLRTNTVGQLAAFIPYPQTTIIQSVVISRGRREGVKDGDLYFIRKNDDTGDDVALLKVTEVREKMAFAIPLWVSEKCPVLKYGWKVFLWDMKNERVNMAKEILAIPEERLAEVIKIIRTGLEFVDILRCLDEPQTADETREQLEKWCDVEEEYLKLIGG